jgi:bifunctional ADP-heptose synthase (sugar kinase/adenylyltransferase)
MDTRHKILTPERALEVAAQLRLEGKPFQVLSGYFDVLQPAIVRSVAAQSQPGAALFALVSDPPQPVMTHAARVELAASLRLIDYVVSAPLDSVQFIARLAPDVWIREEDAHARSTERLIQHVFERHDRAAVPGARH